MTHTKGDKVIHKTKGVGIVIDSNEWNCKVKFHNSGKEELYFNNSKAIKKAH